ncbi:hypothetical protein LNV08_21620 [Paucibacter sp. TC2R-5]|nr:hypothetical protein [Paucibacter sp. TC2R-5]
MSLRRKLVGELVNTFQKFMTQRIRAQRKNNDSVSAFPFDICLRSFHIDCRSHRARYGCACCGANPSCIP